jgi:8-oxo-dGTP diphosphatase
MDTRPELLVVAGLILSEDQQQVLLASRPLGKVYAGWWECPGGKQEPNESLEDALARELQEELGLSVEEASPGWSATHAYSHAHVRLHFFWVTRWRAAGQFMQLAAEAGLEGQQLCWIRLDGPAPFPILPATLPALERARSHRASVRRPYGPRWAAA